MAEPVIESKPVEVTLGDGSVVKGKDLDEAFKNLGSMKENASAEIRRLKEQLQTEQSEKQRIYQEYERARAPKPTNGRLEFDKQHYYELLNTDPVAANDYYFEFRFQQKPEQFTENYQRITEQVGVVEQQSITAAFVAQHSDDFPPTAEAARAMREKVQEYANAGIPFNLKTMNMAYAELVEDGTIKPMEKTVPEEESANPSLSGVGGRDNTDYSDADGWDDKKLEAEMRKRGMLR